VLKVPLNSNQSISQSQLYGPGKHCQIPAGTILYISEPQPKLNSVYLKRIVQNWLFFLWFSDASLLRNVRLPSNAKKLRLASRLSKFRSYVLKLPLPQDFYVIRFCIVHHGHDTVAVVAKNECKVRISVLRNDWFSYTSFLVKNLPYALSCSDWSHQVHVIHCNDVILRFPYSINRHDTC